MFPVVLGEEESPLDGKEAQWKGRDQEFTLEMALFASLASSLGSSGPDDERAKIGTLGLRWGTLAKVLFTIEIPPYADSAPIISKACPLAACLLLLTVS